MTTTTTYIDCVVTTPPPTITFDGGQATDGSCATVQANYPGDTVTPTPITVTTNAPPTTSTTTTTVGISQPGPGTPDPSCYVGCTPSGYAGVSGGGENCGAGPTGSCTAAPVPVASVGVPTPALAFTGADLGESAIIGLVAIVVGVALWRGARRSSAG